MLDVRSGILYKNNTQLSDTGEYSCITSNSNENLYYKFILLIVQERKGIIIIYNLL